MEWSISTSRRQALQTPTCTSITSQYLTSIICSLMAQTTTKWFSLKELEQSESILTRASPIEVINKKALQRIT